MKMADLVRQLLQATGMKQESLAEKLGVTQATVSRWLDGSEPRGDSRDNLLEMGRRAGLLGQTVFKQPKAAKESRFVLVPKISWVSAGRLTEPTDQVPIDDVPKIAIADLAPGDYFALTVNGTSMDRISPKKSIIVVNRREQALHEGKPYVFSIRGEATYKIWRAKPPRLEPLSTDPSHEPTFINRRNRLTIIGRVRRSILEL